MTFLRKNRQKFPLYGVFQNSLSIKDKDIGFVIISLSKGLKMMKGIEIDSSIEKILRLHFVSLRMTRRGELPRYE